MLVKDILLVKKFYFSALSLRFIFFIYNFFVFFNLFSFKTNLFLQLKTFFYKFDIYFYFVNSTFLKYVFTSLDLFGFLTGNILLMYTSNISDFLLHFKHFEHSFLFLPYVFLFRNFLITFKDDFINYFFDLYSSFGKYNYYLLIICSKLIISVLSSFFILFNSWVTFFFSYFWKLGLFLANIFGYLLNFFQSLAIKFSSMLYD